MILIHSGKIGRASTGGQAWVDMQYMLGFRALGHEVYYLEDCGEESWAWNWDTMESTTELDYPAGFVRDCMEQYGFGERWIYRAGDRSAGMSIADFADVCASADLMVVSAVPLWTWRPEYNLMRRRVFIDVDPGFTQMKIAGSKSGWAPSIAFCDRFFTVGQRIGKPGCGMPTAGLDWIATLPPVYLPEWPAADTGVAPSHFTSLLRWEVGFQDVIYQGKSYGQKNREFQKFIDLPRLTPQPFRMGLIGGDFIASHGWGVVAGWEVSRTPQSYRQFIQDSRAEFGVAKHGYVESQGGWFSDRTVCYLASGRPALLQDTGLGSWLPLGEGVLSFRTIEEAIKGIDAINSEYEQHSHAARRLAEEMFSTDRVLTRFLEKSME